MKAIVLFAALTAVSVAGAHELDNEDTTTAPTSSVAAESADQAVKPNVTMVVRTPKSGNGSPEVVMIEGKLDPNNIDKEAIRKMEFIAVPIDTEITGVKITAADEKELTTSMSSYGFGSGVIGGGYGMGGVHVEGPNGGSFTAVGGRGWRGGAAWGGGAWGGAAWGGGAWGAGCGWGRPCPPRFPNQWWLSGGCAGGAWGWNGCQPVQPFVVVQQQVVMPQQIYAFSDNAWDYNCWY